MRTRPAIFAPVTRLGVGNLTATAAALALLGAPVAAQAAPQRSAAPVEQANELHSSWLLAIFALAAFLAAVVIASKSNNNPVSP
jgi:hypothetical protein